MKKLLFIVFILSSFVSLAQNKGKVNENNTARIDYLGWQSNLYNVSLTNKETCSINFKVSWLQKDTVINVQPFQTRQIQLPGPAKPYEVIKAKPESSECNGIDNGWVEIETPASLPVKFGDFSVIQIDPETLLVKFTTYETEGVKQFNIQVSLDGKNYKTVAIIFPDGYNSNTSYKAKIKISSLKQ